MTKRCFFFILFLVVISAFAGVSAAVSAEPGPNEALVTVLQGTARVYTTGVAAGRLLRQGDALRKEEEVKVADKSRMELRFPDGTVMRLAEKSHLRMNEVSFNKQTDGKNVKVDLAVGKIWAKVRKLTTPGSSVEVRTSNAVAGVRGTVYRMNVGDDKSATVKVYDGSVYVANPPRDATKPLGQVAAPHEVPGPHAVAPPFHEVTMEEWTVIVKAMQQVTISPQGVASQPRDFDPKADADDWVKWNQERDAQAPF